MDEMDSEFKGSTKQALVDIRDDIVELKGMVSDIGIRTDSKIEGFIKWQNEKEDRMTGRMASRDQLAQLEKVVVEHEEEIEKMKQRWWYLTGVYTVVMIIATFFSDNIRSIVFRQ